MMVHRPAGFKEIEHMADWELEAWAPDMAGLLEQAARGMYHLAGVQVAALPRIHRQVEIETTDAESLVVSFLSELLFIAETGNQAFDHFNLEVENFSLHASLEGAALESLAKEIKAVTYHKIHVRHADSGLRVNVVFDV